MFQAKAKLLYNKRLARDYFHCALETGEIAHNASPGQFVNIKLSATVDPLLRRPFSIHCVSGSRIEILYEVVGKGTGVFSRKKAGEYLDIIGPLGNGFNYQSSNISQQLSILVAGGMGVAPLIFLAEKLAKSQIPNPCLAGRQAKSQIHVLIGAESKNEILCEKEFKELGCKVKISTDDGSKGLKGKVTDLIKSLLSTADSRPATIYTCGPRPMLKEIASISKRYNIPTQASLEEHMACGIGACLGCVVNTRDGYKRVCKEGPVFNAAEIIW